MVKTPRAGHAAIAHSDSCHRRVPLLRKPANAAGLSRGRLLLKGQCMSNPYGAPSPLLVHFEGRPDGPWHCTAAAPVVGEEFAPAPRMQLTPTRSDAAWRLSGVVSNLRYTTAAEAERLVSHSAGLGRAEAKRGVLIPIRKSSAWWALAQDQRRQIYEEQSRHTSIGMKYLPAVARRLHHSRDLGEPFDFLTWFEFAPEHETAFDDLLAELRASLEWTYVDREVEYRYDRLH